jgi:hypothetical protein
MLLSRFYLVLLMLGGSLFTTTLPAAELFSPDNFPGAWTLVTNADATITATESAIHRQGRVVYSRVLELQAVPAEIPAINPGAATEADIRHFIADYRPPEIPYTSERMALMTGAEKFNCLEFAEDLVRQANNNGVPAQVIGILFQGKWTGHAVAGFPTAEGQTLYFDSTPAAGKISHRAHEAHVEIGQAYSRDDGGELSVVGHLPIAKIIPVTKLLNLASGVGGNEIASMDRVVWTVTGVRRIPADGIDYADTNTLRISDDQLARWKTAASRVLAAQTHQQLAQAFAGQSSAPRAAARALALNEEQAAHNDPYGQLRMGERYLTGDGVPKNPVLAKAYLKQAADQGSPTAAEELKKLTGNISGNSG